MQADRKFETSNPKPAPPSLPYRPPGLQAFTPASTGPRLVAPALLVAVVCISFAAIFFRKAAPTHPLVMAGIRLAIAGAVLLPVSVRSCLRGRLRGRVLGYAVLSGILYGIHFGAWVSSLTLTSVAASVTLVTCTPLLLAVLGLVTGRDRPDRRLWFSLALASVGVSLIGGFDGLLAPGALVGDVLALLGACAIAAYFVLARRLGDALDVWAYGGVATVVGALTLLSTAWAVGIPVETASQEALGYLVLAAVLPQLVGHTLLTWSLRHATPTAVAMAVVGEPVGATLLGWWMLSEAPSTVVLVGCGFTLTAVAISALLPGSSHRPETETPSP